jgi:hypothetical protein
MYERDGWRVHKTEQRLPIPGKFVTQDFGNFADLIAYSAMETVGLQACAISGFAAHVSKIRGLATARLWCHEGSRRRIEVWGWSGRRFRCATMIALADGAWSLIEREGEIA